MYLAYLSFSYSAKNKLEKAILQYLETIDRTNIPDDDLKAFKKAVIDHITDLCQRYKNCKPKEPRIIRTGRTTQKDFMFDGIDCAEFYFYHSTQEYKAGVICVNLFESAGS